MSYPKDLDDYDDDDLIDELRDRIRARDSGVCDYCKRDSAKPAPCGSGRHSLGTPRAAAALRARLRAL